MSRPPSSSSSSSSSATLNPTSTLPRVHGHDHNRPLPPPRLHDITNPSQTIPPPTTTPTAATTTTTTTTTPTPIIPLTAPLTPLSTNSSSINSTTGFVRTSSRAPATVPVHDVVRIPTNHLNDQEQHVQSQILQNSSPRNQSSVVLPVSEVTLTVPRPDGERAVNEYVETPFRPNIVTSSQKCVKLDRTKRHHHHIHHHHHHHHHRNNQSHTGGRNNTTANHHHHPVSSSSPNKNSTITKQPVSFTKEPTNSIGSPGSQLAQQIQQQQQQQQQLQLQQQQQLQQRSTLFTGIGGLGSGGMGGGLLGTGNVGGVIIPLDEGLSIMCEYCGRCKCESCREPPPLPSRWLCDNACFCSAETALDYASCLCCVKGLFYHCGDAAGNGVDADGEGAGSCADEPCSCNGSKRLARWTCLGALALALPCLLCYWPLKGCVALCEACYARHASHGCRCDPSTAGRHLATSTLRDSRDPEKRLLDPVTPEL